MKAFLLSFTFLVVVQLIVCADHLIDAILAHNYGKMVLYGILCLFLLIALILLLV